MKKYICLGALLWIYFGNAQDRDDAPASIESDTLFSQMAEAAPGVLSEETPPEAVSRDSLALEDHPRAARIDSLWIRELQAARENFSQMYLEVQEAASGSLGPLDSLPSQGVSLDTDLLRERLRLLDEKTPFNVSYNPSLERVILHFLTNKRELMERMLGMSQYYFPLFEQTLDQYNLPLEIKYLAIVESALNPRARSRVGATGLWQFMYTTGRMYDLQVSSYVDERSDPERSTDAAARYLSKLYEIFGDWDLALAAYNSGPGNVNKAIRRSGGYENYWHLRPFLPRETAGYVPAFLATMYIFEYAEAHGLSPAEVREPYFETDTLRVKTTITFDQISKYTGAPKEEIEVLNPSYKLGIIPGITGKEYTLRLPRRAIGLFVNNEEAIYARVQQELASRENSLPRYTKAEEQVQYRVRSGDYLGKIAERHGVSVSQIKQWNGLRSNMLRVGQRLTIYPRKPVIAQDVASAPKGPAQPRADEGSEVYVVEKGDSLWTISKKHRGITVENLREWNGIRGNDLKPGTRLKLCNCSP